MARGTIGYLIDHYAPGLDVSAPEPQPPTWPPDAFALVAALLHFSGGYRRVLDDWPPQTPALWPAGMQIPQNVIQWKSTIQQIGRNWRNGALATPEFVPPEVVHWWQFVLALYPLPDGSTGSWEVSALRYDRDAPAAVNATSRDLSHALIMILAAADEASVGAGTPSLPKDATRGEQLRVGLEADLFDGHIDDLLLGYALDRKPSSLCSKLIDSNAIQVLPKQHTPQSGLTIRSMSHNLALRIGDEIHPEWVNTVRPAPTDRAETYYLNLLLVPWPRTIGPAQFTESAVPKGGLCFDFNIASTKSGRADFQRLFRNAMDIVEHIDGVIFPEAAFPEDEHLDYYNAIAEEAWARSTFMVAGMGKRASGQSDGENYVSYICPVGDSRHIHEIVQHKLHRWRLDEPQIRQYGIGSRLNPRKKWWENISLRYRKLHFFSIRPWLTMSVLICEDLARQDSVSDLLRAVGPNLVIAVLMDGPQLATRWPARYATVLADDPGSSVLTLTSVGMAQLSRPTR